MSADEPSEELLQLLMDVVEFCPSGECHHACWTNPDCIHKLPQRAQRLLKERVRQLLYRGLYPSIEAQLRTRHQFHGSEVRDLFIDYACGNFAASTHAEKLLMELHDAGELIALERAPTASQAAFSGLTISGKHYRALPLGVMTAEHHWWRWREPANDNGTAK